ncbi:MAG: TIGR04282 family arsenosugar biosynthesis glycosyltransferase [Thermodesulfobacteriota bacterium]
MDNGSLCVMIFVRDPVLGEVKTRLAGKLGEIKTLEFYKDCVTQMLSALESSGYPVRVHYFPWDRGESVSRWLGNQHHYIPQEGSDLGERMASAFLRSFSDGYSRSILMGSDIPEFTGSILQESASALIQNQSVIGPSADGGYYLIGFRSSSFLPKAFQNIRWGSGSVFQDTVNRILETGLSIHILPMLQDIDELEDLIDFLNRISPGSLSPFSSKNYLDLRNRSKTGEIE